MTISPKRPRALRRPQDHHIQGDAWIHPLHGEEAVETGICLQQCSPGLLYRAPCPHLTTPLWHSLQLSCWLPWRKKGKSGCSTLLSPPSGPTQPSLLTPPFFSNRRQGHYIRWCLVLLFPPRMRRALLPLRVYVSSFHWHWFLCYIAQLLSWVKSVLTIHFHWSSFSVHVPRPGFSFLRNKGSCLYSDLVHNLFQDDIWPRSFAFWLSCCWYCYHTRFPCEQRPSHPLWIAKGITE